ncbi:unnamed protein product, partial [Brassica oleracea]
HFFTNAVTPVEILMDSFCSLIFRSKLQSLFLQSLQHLKLLQWFHLDCVEIREMPYILTQ